MIQNNFEGIEQELYNLNETLQTFMFLLADLHGKPLEFLHSDGNYKFMEVEK